MGNPEKKPCRVENTINAMGTLLGLPNCPLILLGGGWIQTIIQTQKKLVYNGNINKGLLAQDVLIVFPQAYYQNHYKLYLNS